VPTSDLPGRRSLNQMRYPKDFPPESRAAVLAEKLRAGRDFDQARENPLRPQYGLDQYLEAELRRYILRTFIVFVREACKLGHKRIWHVDRVEQAAREFLRLATIDAVYDKSGGAVGRNWNSHLDGSIQSEVMRQFERSGEWQQFQDALLQVAEGQAARASEAGAAADPGPAAEPARRCGYRAEVRAWMKREGVLTLDPAAKRLAISLSALKSIMSVRGKRRYSQTTLNRILEIIGPKGE